MQHLNCAATDLAEPVALLLTNLIKSQQLRAQQQQQQAQAQHPMAAAFESRRPAAVSLRAYLVRLAQYSGAQVNTVVAALAYVDRLVEMHSGGPAPFLITDANVHRVVLACLVIALKFFEDHFYTNAFYARVGGVPVEELNALEVALLSMLQFSLFITPELYQQYEQALAAAAAFCLRQREQAAILAAAAAQEQQQLEAAVRYSAKEQALSWYPSAAYVASGTTASEPGYARQVY
eukprot:TRINITY_DN445_c0_g1_i1.p1 TRINITY_DN445_c0_g1~~TRINITY_DN445_c0_g1_i1.p1  ORF type:complete len:245 (+),score=106.46 TRINITY_DN445_c0_g1_i1:33-737(+)